MQGIDKGCAKSNSPLYPLLVPHSYQGNGGDWDGGRGGGGGCEPAVKKCVWGMGREA
jgi:hypothetical protein